MARRLLAIGGIAALFASAAAPGASASAPEGPRLAFTRLSGRPEALQILSTDPIGGAAQLIVSGDRRHLPLPYPFTGPSWSPDGSQLAFSGVPRLPRRHGAVPPLQVYVVAADGGGLRAVPGTNGGYAPIFSPDGHTLAFSRVRERVRGERGKRRGMKVVYESASIWLVDLTTGAVRQLTPWRNHLVNVASSFSPDGSVLALSRRVGNRQEAVALRLDGSGSTVLSKGGLAPVYSPDGSQIALLRGKRRTFRERHREGRTIVTSTTTTTMTDLFVMSADGSGLRRLTDTPRLIESAAGWDPSGQRLAYVARGATSLEGILGFADTIVEQNADGTCRTPVLTDPGFAFYGPAWQPGPGRAAGRIPC